MQVYSHFRYFPPFSPCVPSSSPFAAILQAETTSLTSHQQHICSLPDVFHFLELSQLPLIILSLFIETICLNSWVLQNLQSPMSSPLLFVPKHFPSISSVRKLASFCTSSLTRRTPSSKSDLFPTPFIVSSFLFPAHALHFYIPSEKQQGGHSTKICFHRAKPWNWICICKWDFPNKFSKPCPNRHQTQFNTLLPTKFKAILLKGSLQQLRKLTRSMWEGKIVLKFFFHFAVTLELPKRLLLSYSWHCCFQAEKCAIPICIHSIINMVHLLSRLNHFLTGLCKIPTFFSSLTSTFVHVSNLFRRFIRSLGLSILNYFCYYVLLMLLYLIISVIILCLACYIF